jgi:zinc protease
MKKIFLSSASFAFVLFATAQVPTLQLIEKVEPQKGKLVIPYEKYKLTSNDLTLIIHEDHSDPVVHVQVAYHVGSARESVRNSGFAHFFEHMMFQGSKNVADEEHFKIISEAGGTNNAFTSFDKTVYINTAPSNLTETMLWLEADRMGLHLDGFTQKKFENQRDAVKNEKRQRYDNQPYGMVNENLFKNVFFNHPYEWTPIGFVDDLDAASFEDLRSFFLRWYGPNNATLVISGDVNPQDIKQWVIKYFSSLEKCPAIKNPKVEAPFFPADVYVPMTDNIWLPLTLMSYPTVAEYHKDRAALDLLGSIMGGNNNSLLYKKFVKSEKAVQVSTDHSSLELSGLFSLSVVANFNGLTFSEIEKMIREVFDEFAKNGITDAELDKAKKGYTSQVMDNLTSVSSKALLLSHWNMMLNKPYNLQDEVDVYQKVTKEDVMRVFEKYIRSQKAVILNVAREEPKEGDDEKSKSINPHANVTKITNAFYASLKYTPPVDDFDRSKKPAIPPARVVKFPDYYTQSFDNGLKVIGTKTTEIPKVYLYLNIEGGHMIESDKKIKIGTAYLTAQMLEQGTAKLSSEEYSDALDKLGSSININAGNFNTTIFVESLKENLDQTFDILQQVLMTPRFDEKDFQRVKKQNLESVQNQKSNPNLTANKVFNKIFYQGTFMADYYTGDYKSLSKISLAECKAFHAAYYSPNYTTLSIAGDIDKDEVLAKLGFLKTWAKKDFVMPVFPPLKMPDKTQIYLVDKPYAAQSTIVVGHPSLKYDYNGEYYKNTVMNFPLGGAFNSRINLNLREDKGYTYGARSYFTGNKYNGAYMFSGDVKKEATDSTLTELMKEIRNFKSGGVKAEELTFTKNSILLSEALNYETPFQKLSLLNNILQYNLPNDYTKEQQQIVASLTAQDINMLAGKNLHPDKMIIVVVGHGFKIRSGLEKLGLGKIKELDYDGN